MTTTHIKLLEPKNDGRMSVERALFQRRSVREFRTGSLSPSELSQLLWAAQGVTALGGYRTAPSAGALYPLELYVAMGQVHDLAPGLYHYRPEHALAKLSDHDVRRELGEAALEQTWLQNAQVVLVLTAVTERATVKYGQEHGRRYMHLEAGHVAENVALQAVALDLGSVAVAAFDEPRVRHILHLKAGEEPLYLLPVGKK